MDKKSFDWKWYLAHNPDLIDAGITTADQAYRHWIRYGYRERRLCRKIPNNRPTPTLDKSMASKLVPQKPQFIIMIHVFTVSVLQNLVIHISHLISRYPAYNFFIITNIAEHPDISYREEHASRCRQVFERFRVATKFIQTPNKGGDIGGLLQMIKYMYEHYMNIVNKTSYWMFFHTKGRNEWRQQLCLAISRYPLDKLLNNASVGIIGSRKWVHKFGPNINKSYYDSFARHLRTLNKYYRLDINSDWKFIAGTMFIINRHIIHYIYQSNLDQVYQLLNTLNSVDENWVTMVEENGLDRKDHGNDLSYRWVEGEPLLPDYMIEHAYERLVGLICQHLKLTLIGN